MRPCGCRSGGPFLAALWGPGKAVVTSGCSYRPWGEATKGPSSRTGLREGWGGGDSGGESLFRGGPTDVNHPRRVRVTEVGLGVPCHLPQGRAGGKNNGVG